MAKEENGQKRKRPTIPESVKIELWARAAGRCEFKGCNKPLYKDELTQKKDNLATISHIVAFSPDGPRGHEVDSKRLEKDISNLMLTCRDHGKIIDSHSYVKEYPVEVLRAYKKEHEDRIRILTSIQEEMKTHILILQVPINGKSFTIDISHARQAIQPRYPADENGLVIDLSDVSVPESSPDYWNFMAGIVKSRFNELMGEGIKKGRINHVSVFGLAPIPLLMHFGAMIGNIIPADFYQRHRDSQSWTWNDEDSETGDFYSFIGPSVCSSSKDVALILSVSGRVDREKVEAAMNREFISYEILVKEPDLKFLKSRERLRQFGCIYSSVIGEIRGKYGHDCAIHVFPAIPAPVAMECGRSLMSKCDPSIHVYDLLPEKGFQFALSLQGSSCATL